MSSWSASDVPDQAGHTILVTGANSGIGQEAARVLAARGAHVLIGARTAQKGQRTVDELTAAGAPGGVELLSLDLADLDSVRSAADQVRRDHERLDVLVNNAGVMAPPRRLTAQGFEQQFGVNHLGHFALTAHLLPILLATPHSRVVSLASMAHRFGQMNFEDLQSEHGYDAWRAYGQSKLANLLFVLELQRRLTAAGSTTIAAAAHPGLSRTNLGHDSSGGLISRAYSLVRPVMDRVISQSAQMGALPTLRAATAPGVRGGDYYGPSGLGEQRGAPKLVGMTDAAKDDAAARRLWAVSEELTGASTTDTLPG